MVARGFTAAVAAERSDRPRPRRVVFAIFNYGLASRCRRHLEGACSGDVAQLAQGFAVAQHAELMWCLVGSCSHRGGFSRGRPAVTGRCCCRHHQVDASGALIMSPASTTRMYALDHLDPLNSPVRAPHISPRWRATRCQRGRGAGISTAAIAPSSPAASPPSGSRSSPRCGAARLKSSAGILRARCSRSQRCPRAGGHAARPRHSPRARHRPGRHRQPDRAGALRLRPAAAAGRHRVW